MALTAGPLAGTRRRQVTGPRHPPWCAGHDDNGRCVGEFDGPGPVDGWHVYARPTAGPDGAQGVEVAVVEDGGPITRINVDLGKADL